MEQKMHSSLLRLLLKALRFPLILLIVGYSLSSLVFIPLLNNKKEWHGLLMHMNEGKITVADFKEYSVELSIVVSAATPAVLRNLLPEIREKVLEFMRDNYPHSFPSMRMREK